MNSSVLCIAGWAQPPHALQNLGECLTTSSPIRYTSVSELCGQHGEIPFVEGLKAFVHCERIQVSTLLGWSMGGVVAVDAIRQGLLEVEQLVLLSSTLSYCGKDPTGVPVQRLQEFQQELMNDKGAALLQFFLNVYSVERLKRALLKEFLRYAVSTPPGVLETGLDYLLTTDLRTCFQQIRVPVLIAHGERDTVIPIGAAREAKDLRPDSELLVLPESGHAACVLPDRRLIDAVQVYVR